MKRYCIAVFITFLGLIFLPFQVYPYSHTITIDGVNDFTSGEWFPTSTSGYKAYVSWDAQHLYLGSSGASIGSANNWLLVYLECGAGGSNTGRAFNTQQPSLSFAATHLFAWRGDNAATILFNYNSSTGWTSMAASLAKAQIPGQFEEAAIHLNDLGNPSTLRMATFWINETTGTEWSYAGMPNTVFTDGYDPNIASSLYVNFQSPNAPNAVPVPPTVWLLGSGLVGLVGLRRRFTAFLKK